MARKRKLEGSTAIVTGGSSGIGLAAASAAGLVTGACLIRWSI